MKITIKPVASAAFSVELPSPEEATVADLKQAASASGAAGTGEASRIKLVFRGHVLKDSEAVAGVGAFFFFFHFLRCSSLSLSLSLCFSHLFFFLLQNRKRHRHPRGLHRSHGFDESARGRSCDDGDRRRRSFRFLPFRRLSSSSSSSSKPLLPPRFFFRLLPVLDGLQPDLPVHGLQP